MKIIRSTIKQEIAKGNKSKLEALTNGDGYVMINWIRRAVAYSYCVIAVDESTGEYIGWAAVSPVNSWYKRGKHSTIGFFVKHEFRNQGIAKKLGRELLSWRRPSCILAQPAQSTVQKVMLGSSYKMIDPGSLYRGRVNAHAQYKRMRK